MVEDMVMNNNIPPGMKWIFSGYINMLELTKNLVSKTVLIALKERPYKLSYLNDHQKLLIEQVL